MSTPVRYLLDAAYALSDYNEPDVPGRDRELVAALDFRIKELYVAAANINPSFFGVIATVAPVAGVWQRPADAVLVERLLMPDGKEVSILSYEDREREFPPRVFEWGRAFRTVGGADDPQTEQLTFHYAKSHPSLSLTAPPDGQTLDPTWPRAHDEILIRHLAAQLAMRDSREGEAAQHKAEEEKREVVFLSHVATTLTQRAFRGKLPAQPRQQ
jgi:hypothetical protein